MLGFSLNRKDLTLTHIYLTNEADGLMTRESGEYAKEKLDILVRFMQMFTAAMKNRPWAALNYIDLLAGPGKNEIRGTREIVLGSPLLALRYQFDNYFFVEKGAENFESLEARVLASPRSELVRQYNADCNFIVGDIVKEILAIERFATNRSWRSLNLIFADPEGFELQWPAISMLGRESRSDLIVNFSTSGITRNIREAFKSAKETAIDRFLGSRDWRETYARLPNRGDGTIVRRFVLDFYAERLSQLGYITTAPNGEYIVLNSTNRQLYSLFCASKHPLGIEFFDEAAKKFKQSGLPGF